MSASIRQCLQDLWHIHPTPLCTHLLGVATKARHFLGAWPGKTKPTLPLHITAYHSQTVNPVTGDEDSPSLYQKGDTKSLQHSHTHHTTDTQQPLLQWQHRAAYSWFPVRSTPRCIAAYSLQYATQANLDTRQYCQRWLAMVLPRMPQHVSLLHHMRSMLPTSCKGHSFKPHRHLTDNSQIVPRTDMARTSILNQSQAGKLHRRVRNPGPTLGAAPSTVADAMRPAVVALPQSTPSLEPQTVGNLSSS